MEEKILTYAEIESLLSKPLSLQNNDLEDTNTGKTKKSIWLVIYIIENDFSRTNNSKWPQIWSTFLQIYTTCIFVSFEVFGNDKIFPRIVEVYFDVMLGSYLMFYLLR